MLELSFSSKLGWGSGIVSIDKSFSKKIWALIRSMKFVSAEVVLYCCHVWAGTARCYLDISDKIEKRIRGTVGPSVAASLEPLAHCQNLATSSLSQL